MPVPAISPQFLRPVIGEDEYMAGLKNPRHREFVRAYLETGDPHEAFVRAGYLSVDRKDEDIKIRRLLTSDAIREALDLAAGFDAEVAAAQVTVPRTLAELSRIAFSDPRALVDENGKLLSLRDMPQSTAVAIASMKVKISKGGDDEPDEVVEIKFWDKPAALDKIAKHLGITKEQAPVGTAENPLHMLVQQMQGTALIPTMVDVTPEPIEEAEIVNPSYDEWGDDDE